MDYISSKWQIVFDPAGADSEIVGFGQLIDKELEWQMSNALEVIAPVDSITAYLRDEKLATYSLTVRTYNDRNLDVDAREAMMSAMVFWASKAPKPMRVKIEGGTGYWQFSRAFVRTLAPMRHLNSGKARRQRTWNIIATGLSYSA